MSFDLPRTILVGALTPALVIVPLPVGAGRSPAGTVAMHDVGALPWTPLRPGIQIKPVVGRTGTFVLAELEPRAQTLPHHHTHEQANFGLAGSIEIAIGDTTHGLAPFVGTLAPPDAQHFIVNRGAVNAVLLEFQPIRRLDLLPPRPPLTFPSAPAAAPLARDRVVAMDFAASAGGWKARPDGVRLKTLTGTTCTLAVWDVPAAVRGWVDLTRHTPRAEQFLYSVAGEAEVRGGSDAYRLRPGTLLVNAADAAHIAVRPIETGRAVLVVFEAASR